MHFTGHTLDECENDAGSSLIEVLVVLVVFAVGILGVAQVFPGGFKILANTQALSIANALGRDRGRAIKVYAHSQQLPDMILPVTNTDVGGVDRR